MSLADKVDRWASLDRISDGRWLALRQDERHSGGPDYARRDALCLIDDERDRLEREIGDALGNRVFLHRGLALIPPTREGNDRLEFRPLFPGDQ